MIKTQKSLLTKQWKESFKNRQISDSDSSSESESVERKISFKRRYSERAVKFKRSQIIEEAESNNTKVLVKEKPNAKCLVISYKNEYK
jgi:hypothetical protein